MSIYAFIFGHIESMFLIKEIKHLPWSGNSGPEKALTGWSGYNSLMNEKGLDKGLVAAVGARAPSRSFSPGIRETCGSHDHGQKRGLGYDEFCLLSLDASL